MHIVLCVHIQLSQNKNIYGPGKQSKNGIRHFKPSTNACANGSNGLSHHVSILASAAICSLPNKLEDKRVSCEWNEVMQFCRCRAGIKPSLFLFALFAKRLSHFAVASHTVFCWLQQQCRYSWLHLWMCASVPSGER